MIKKASLFGEHNIPVPKVIIILDDTFGGRLEAISAFAPVWIVDSIINREVCERLWRESKHISFRENGAITCFRPKDTNNRVGTLIDILPDVENHHGRAENNEVVFQKGFILDVIGLSVNKELINSFKQYGFTSFIEKPEGFQATKI